MKVMGGHHDRGTLCCANVSQHREYGVGRAVIEVGGGFISEDDGRLVHQGPGYGHPLHLTTGKPINSLVKMFTEPNFVQQLGRPRRDLFFILRAAKMSGQHDVF